MLRKRKNNKVTLGIYSYKLHSSASYYRKSSRGLVTISYCLGSEHTLSLSELIIEPIRVTQAQKKKIRSQLKIYTINYLKDRPLLSLDYTLRQVVKNPSEGISNEYNYLFS